MSPGCRFFDERIAELNEEAEADKPAPPALTPSEVALAKVLAAWEVHRFCEDEGVPHKNSHEGPNMPLRYGSARTVVCAACGAYKLVTWLGADYSGWRTGDVHEDVRAAIAASEDQ